MSGEVAVGPPVGSEVVVAFVVLAADSCQGSFLDSYRHSAACRPCQEHVAADHRAYPGMDCSSIDAR